MIGGVENVVMDLAMELSKLGHKVKVLTLTKANSPDSFPFEVIRQARFIHTVRLIKWGDIVVQTNVSLKGFIPALLARRPLIINHQNEYPSTFNGVTKRWVAQKLAINVSCSMYISGAYDSCQVLLNPYNNQVFKKYTPEIRTKDIVFLGRLVSVKGVDILLRALQLLRKEPNCHLSLTIIGDGPEKLNLLQLVEQLGLQTQVNLIGNKTGDELAGLLNQHKLMVVPSIYEEPFGIVALEGIACGCMVIGSKAGGLPEAIGPCGVTFPMGNASALATLIEKALSEPDWRATHQAHAITHLAVHTRKAIAKRFLEILDNHL